MSISLSKVQQNALFEKYHSTINQNVRIWLWLKRPNDHLVAATYEHVALEIINEGNEADALYMSFWKQSHRKIVGCNVKTPHFHSTKRIDDQICRHCTTIYYDVPLNIHKVQRAFALFKKNPHAWGSLGWNFLHRPYSFDAVGLTFYLLEQGGIFKTVSKKYSFWGEIFRLISFFGASFSVFNFWSAKQLHHLSISADTDFNTYNHQAIGVMINNLLAFRKIDDIQKIAQNLLPHDPEGNATQIVNATQTAVSVFNLVFTNGGKPNAIIVHSIKDAAFSASHEIMKVSKLAFCVAGVAFGFYWVANRFFIAKYCFADVERYAQKVKQNQEKQQAA